MSKIWKLDWKDLLKGLVTVSLSAIFYALISWLPKFGLPTEVVAILSVMLGYLAKNLATTDDGKLLGRL